MSRRVFIAAILLVIVGAAIAIGFVQRSQVLAQGCFHQVAHKGRGCATLIRRADDKTVLQLSNFATAENPDLRVILISAEDALENTAVLDSQKIDLGPLQTSEGTQEYVIPRSVAIGRFRAVTVWNDRHQVNFTTAPLKRQ